MRKYLSLICLILLFVVVVHLEEDKVVVSNETTSDNEDGNYVVVIDPGHGGFDPGKVGVTGVLEKDINLIISQKLKTSLEANGCTVIMTREDDTGLYSESDSNKKNSDMKNRVKIINETKPDVAVSIHQNSFSQESIKGAQVFYHVNSADGKVLAETIQEQIKITIGDGNHRVAKSDNTYYMLKNTDCPLVIVECGFLSNYNESKLLCEDEYQNKMTEGITLGIMKYLVENYK